MPNFVSVKLRLKLEGIFSNKTKEYFADYIMSIL